MVDYTVHNLLNGATLDGSYNVITIKNSIDKMRGGRVYVFGTFDGATVTIEMSQDGVVWQPVTSPAAFTAAGHGVIEWPLRYLRATISNDGTNTSLSAGFV